ncbi:MAG: M48 family metallopeptidase [Methylococcaceae bacterium]
MKQRSDLPFSYTLRYSQRSTRVRIIVSADKVEVVAPVKVSAHRIQQFVYEKQQWILSALSKIASKVQLNEIPLTPVLYHDGAEIAYLGASYRLTIRPTTLKRLKIEFSDEFVAYIPEALLIREHSEDIKAALIVWMKKQAKLHVERLVNQHADKKQLFPRTINIRTQKSRWGSCGIHNDIQINWLLTMAPMEVLEYVVVHELCHIQVRNHSSHFWALVAHHLPDYQSQRRWLRQHGSHLMRGL